MSFEKEDVNKTAAIIVEALQLNNVDTGISLSATIWVMKCIAQQMRFSPDEFEDLLKILMADYREDYK